MPELLKIGLTARPVEHRMYDLHSTGVPTPFVKEFALHVEDARAVEQAVHERLSECRVSANREFFRCSMEAARTNVIIAAEGVITNGDVLPEFAAFYDQKIEAIALDHRAKMDDLEGRRRFWRTVALALCIPAGLFVMAVVGVVSA